MFFDFLKRGRLHKRLDKINKSLNYSFQNIKKDISNTHQKIDKIHNHHISRLDLNEERIKHIEQKVEMLINLLNTKEKIRDQTSAIEFTNTDLGKVESITEVLTDTQKRTFIILFQLQNQIGKESISFKSIAKILYPEKKYNSVRSTLSEYFTVLHELGLIDKKRRGKETTVSISNLGHKVIKKISKKKKLKNKNESKR